MLRYGTAAAFVALVVLACSPQPDSTHITDTSGNEPVDAGSTVIANRVEIVAGVPNRGRDPSVVAVRRGHALCTGSLISPRLVLTARHCVSRSVTSVACPAESVQVLDAYSPGDLEILAGEDVASARVVAHGLSLVMPSGVTLCDADIAVIVLDTAVTTLRPLPLPVRGPAAGDHVRAVGFGRAHDAEPAGMKLVREHVRVLDVSGAEFTVGEATCQGDSGGPALDEDTGEILGVVSRGGPACDGPSVHNVYTRVDTFAWLTAEAFAKVTEIDVEERADAGAEDPAPKAPKKGTHGKPPSDIGGPCEAGDGCAAGICITDSGLDGGTRSYCSRPCGSGDRCPTRYHCEPVAGLEDGSSACINVR